MKKKDVGICALAMFGCFSYGIVAYKQNLWPSQFYSRAFEAYKAEKERRDEIKAVMGDRSGLEKRKIENIAPLAKAILLDAQKVDPGLTLVMVGSDAAMLIDMSGKPRHIWKLPFSKIWGEKLPHVASPNPDPMTRFIDAHLYPNGDLLAIYHADNDTPYGYGMVKMDKDAKVIWSYPKNAHHHMYVADDGRIYTLIQSYSEDYATVVPQYESPVLADAVSILSPDGQEESTITIIEALLGTPYEQLLYNTVSKNDASKHDYTHANSVMPLEPAIADKFPMFRAGQLLVSLRNLNALVVIDPETKKVVWAMQGIFKQQHEARFLPNGHIMLFDNLGFTNGAEDPRSRILEIDPATGGIPWSYNGENSDMFYSSYHGSEQPLANGNLLTVETGEGNKIMEITPQKEVVWRYIVNPRNFRLNPLNMAYRIPAGFLAPEFCAEVDCENMNLPQQKPAGNRKPPSADDASTPQREKDLLKRRGGGDNKH